MCGIAGKLFFDPTARVESSRIGAMLRPMRHRGPDGDGIHLDKNALWFASELKGIITDPAVKREINSQTIRTFLSFNYVAGEETLFRSIRKLLPGHYLLAENGKVTTRQYWDLRYTEDRWSQSF